MPKQETSATQTESLTEDKETSNLSSGGKQTQKSQGQLAAEQAAEKYRKEIEARDEQIGELRDLVERSTSRIEELTSLVEAGVATKKQEQELNQLNQNQGDLEWQLAQLENDPKNKLGYLSIDRRINKQSEVVKAQAKAEALYDLQVGLIEDAAEESGIDKDKFTKELIPIAQRFQFDSNGKPINVYRKAQLAIREWKKQDAKKKADAEERRKQAEANSSRESGTTEARESGALDRRTSLQPQTKEMGDALKSLGL